MNKDLMQESEVKNFYENELKNNLMIKRVAVVGGGVVILGVMSTVLVSALTAGLALSALAVVGTATFLGGIYTYKSIPGWITKIENMAIEQKHKAMLTHIENMKGLAKKNPIEQMEISYQSNIQRLKVYNEAVVGLKSAVENQKRTLKQIKKDKPHYDMSAEEEQTAKMEQFVVFKEKGLNEAKNELSIFKDKMDQVKVKWTFQLEANKALQAMDRTSKDSMMQELLTETAFGEVEKSVDTLLSRMEIEINQINLTDFSKMPQLSMNDKNVIDVEVFKKESVNG
jgi:hypothetical protein